MKKFFLILFVLIIIFGGGGYFIYKKLNSNSEPDYTTVAVKRGTIVEKALAVGKIEPKKEIAVKSKISGIVKKVYVDIGDIVKQGQLLFEISPNPTPYEYAEVKSSVDIAWVRYESAKRNFDRSQSLFKQALISREELDINMQKKDESKLQWELAKERLALLEEGKMKIADRDVENVIRAPVAGMILERKVNEGDPVVPLTSYQAGTELMTMADMKNLIFKGTVDEIDVGKLYEKMPATVTIGALPSVSIPGKIRKIAPKAKIEQNATLFDIEIVIERSDSVILRAGYSANADIIIQKKDSVLMIPERLVTFKGDSVSVEVETEPNTVIKKSVELGISDGINVEMVSGLNLEDKVVERPPKKID